MKTTFFYKILSNDVAPSEGNMDLVIKSVFMNIIAKSENGFTREYGCNYDLPSPSPASYTPFQEVTEPIMVDWVKEMHSDAVNQIEHQLDSEIAVDVLKNIIVNHPLPF